MPSVKPGEVFYDKTDDLHYERCILGPDGERGGTGEMFIRVSHDQFDKNFIGKGWTDEEVDAFYDSCEIIHDVEIGPFTMIRRV